MKIEQVRRPQSPAKREGWLRGWYRVAEDDGSTVAYCPDVATANMIIEAAEIRQYLIDRCRITEI